MGNSTSHPVHDSMPQQNSVIFEQQGSLAIATLNRPQALNALNLEMFTALRRQILAWSNDPSVAVISIRGAGKKAFCAGGDVKSLVIQLREERVKSQIQTSSRLPSVSPDSYAFFIEEYSLDYLIHTCKKPVLVVSHGVTMGGGMGLLVGGAVRLVEPKSVLAMPEISIGYFTDVGASYFLNQMPGKAGLFCGLTAARMNASDAIYLGLADLSLEPQRVSGLFVELSRIAPSEKVERGLLMETVKKAGGQDASVLPSSLFQKYQSQIDQLCEGGSIVEVAQSFEKLKHRGASEFPWDLSRFWTGSPTSASVIFELLKRSQGRSLRECFDMELNLALEFCRRAEFVEGVRALLIDKDQTPRWNPAQLDQVNPAEVDAHFTQEYRIEVVS